MSETLTCRHLFDGENLLGPHRITLVDRIVTEIAPFDGVPECFLLSPGLVDIQMNGFEDVDVSTASEEELFRLGNRLESLGVTSWLATITTAPLDVLSASIDRITLACHSKSKFGCLGIHIEGPFLGLAPGAHRNEWIIPFDKTWAAQLPSSVRLMTIAAEQQDVATAVRSLVSQNILVSIGHSRPSYDAFTSARSAGASMVTHLFNGMSGVHHRDDGLAMYALNDDEVFVGLIGDLVHVSPEAVALAFRAKGSSRICLVSDSVAWLSQSVERRGVEMRDGAVRMANDTLAGSSTALSECLRRIVQEAHVPLEDALRSATSTPAKALGLSDVGHIATGAPVDLVAFDDSLHVVGTWRRLVSLRG